MTTPSSLNECHQAEEPARVLLDRLGWTYVPREALPAAQMRLNDWLSEEQAERAIFELEHVNEVGIARNRTIHEYLTVRLLLTVNTPR